MLIVVDWTITQILRIFAVHLLTANPLDRSLNVAINHTASRLYPTGFDVGDPAPATLADLRAHVARTGRMLVWSGGSTDTIYDDQETNYAFRAWHDWHHWRYGYAFDLAGETLAYHGQCCDLDLLYRGHDRLAAWKRILWAEVVGQALHHDMFGCFPVNQRAFVEACLALPRGHLIPGIAY